MFQGLEIIFQEPVKGPSFLWNVQFEHPKSAELTLDLRSYVQGSCLRTTQLLPLTSVACTNSLASATHSWGEWPGEKDLVMGN